MKIVQSKSKHKSIGGLWIMVVVLMLLMATTLAETSSFGVLDFIKPVNPEAIIAQVQDLTGTEAIETSLVRYQLYDALVDGNHVMFTIHCELIEPDKYLLIPYTDPNDGDPATGKTYAELAKEAGKVNVFVQYDASINGEISATSNYSILQDGKLYLLLETSASLMKDKNEIVCTILDNTVFGAEFVKETDESLGVEGYFIPDLGEKNEATISFSIENTIDQTGSGTIRFTGPFESEFATIDWVEYRQSSLNTALRIQYTIHEDLSSDDLKAIKLMVFKLMRTPEDEFGIGMSGSSGRVDGKPDLENIKGVTFLQEWTGDAVETPPDTLYLRPRHSGGGVWRVDYTADERREDGGVL